MATAPQMGIIDLQFSQLKERHPGATMVGVGDTFVISVPDLPLVPGWTKPRTTVHFVAPAGYPYAAPDCFHADVDLRLNGGGMPQSSGIQILSSVGQTLWFSWHVHDRWRPNRDTLLSYLRVATDRLANAS